jgi:hypothetical protein
VIAHVVVPERVACVDRAIGIAELSASVRKADDQRRQGGADHRLVSGTLRCRELARDDFPDVLLVDRPHDPQLVPVDDEVADFRYGAEIADLPSSGEVERDAHQSVTHWCRDARYQTGQTWTEVSA